MPIYILQVSSHVQRCSLDLVKTTELRIFNELNVYRVQQLSSQFAFFFSLKKKKRKPVKTPYITALKLFKKPLSSSLYKLQITFIKRYSPLQCIRCVLVSNERRIFKYIIVQYVTANSPLRRIRNIHVKGKLPPAIRLL